MPEVSDALVPGTAAEAVCARDASTADNLLVALSKLP